MHYVAYVFAAFVVVVFVAAVWRFVAVRNTGSQGLLRHLPASGVHGWRHGVFRYTDENLKFYKLRSLAFQSDVVLSRRGTEVDGFRDINADEREIMPDVDRVLVLSTPKGGFEFASDKRARMALVSWLESAPNERQLRRVASISKQRGGRARSGRS